MARVKTFANGGTVLPTDLNSIQDAIATIIDDGTLPIAKIVDPGVGKVIGHSGAGTTAIYPPGYEIGYDPIIAGVAIPAGSTGQLIIAGSAHAFDGTPVIAEFYSPGVYVHSGSSLGYSFVQIVLREAATAIAIMANPQALSPSLELRDPVCARFRFTPSAGNHTYSIYGTQNGDNFSAQVDAGNGAAGATAPAFLRFTKA